MKYSSLVAASAASVLLVAGLIGCAPPEKDSGEEQTQSGVNAGEATSAADFGGMEGLVEAAKKEGELNVIALPPDWANYGAIIKAFVRVFAAGYVVVELIRRRRFWRRVVTVRHLGVRRGFRPVGDQVVELPRGFAFSHTQMLSRLPARMCGDRTPEKMLR